MAVAHQRHRTLPPSQARTQVQNQNQTLRRTTKAQEPQGLVQDPVQGLVQGLVQGPVLHPTSAPQSLLLLPLLPLSFLSVQRLLLPSRGRGGRRTPSSP